MNNHLDANIPILTEVISPPPAAELVPAAPAVHAAPARAAMAGAAATPAVAAPAAIPGSEAHDAQLLRQMSDKEREQLEHRLAERMLRQLQGRVEFVLEQRVRDSLADVLQLALAGLTAEIKHGLQQTLEEVIARAVTQEISRLQSLKK